MRMSSIASAATAITILAATSLPVASAAPPKCSDVGGTLGPGQLCQIQAVDPNYTMNIGFPADYPDQKSLIDYVKQTRDGYLNMAKTPDGRPAPYALETKPLEFNSAVPPRGTQSVVLETYESVGGAHPTTFYKGFNWDQGYRKAITIDTLFREGTAPFPVILPLVQAELQKQLGDTETISPAVGMDPATYQNFAITNDSLIFFFDRGAVLSEAAGALQVQIPRGPVDAMIA